MAKKKSKPKSPFTGRWRIVSMSAWEDEYLDEEVQAFFEFEETGSGSFQFGYIQGLMDCRDDQPGRKTCGGILLGGRGRCRRHPVDGSWLGDPPG